MTEPASQLLLIGESFSPWTKKARWALEQCDHSYDYKEYTPALSEPALRLRLRKLKGTVSVPLGPAMQSCWHNRELAREFKDLLGWRNRSGASDITSYSQFKLLTDN